MHRDHGVGVDLPKIWHATLMPRADKWDAMIVAVLRDGNIYFGTDKVSAAELPVRISEKLRDRSVERKIYIKADARSKYSALAGVLDAIHSTGIERVGFLVDERKPVALSH